MHLLNNLHFTKEQLNNKLISLNEKLQGNNNQELSHYLLQWVVNNTRNSKDIESLIRYLDNNTD